MNAHADLLVSHLLLSKTHASAARDAAWETIDERERRVELKARVNGEAQPLWTWP